MDLEFRPMNVPETVIRTFRAATGKDLPFATEVLSGRVKFRECVHDGQLAGHCVGNSATGEILSLSVAHSYRRQGIARKLLSLVVDLMRADGAQRIWLAAPRDSTLPAYRFYRALGWQPTGEQLTHGDEILELPIADRGDRMTAAAVDRPTAVIQPLTGPYGGTEQPLFADEISCADSILSTEVVQTLYETLGTDPEIIKARLGNLRSQDENPDIGQVRNAGSEWHRYKASLTDPIPVELRLLIGLTIHGTVAVKEALTPVGGKPGDIPFFVVHKQMEAELQSRWAKVDEQTGKVLLLDDPFTLMVFVVDALKLSFGMDRTLATKKMLEVHSSGSCVLELDPGTNVSDTCSRLNSEWRSVGLPLYCEPQRLSSATSLVQ
jgi:ATP-dependent Clp protease adapter protein ClpS/GNAT superfamily N-acetyltransferase